MNSTPNWKTPFVEFETGRAKIQQLAELTAVQDLAATAAENQRNREAESAYVRKNLWGADVDSKSEEDMGNTTILGNVTHNVAPLPMTQPKQSSSLLPIIAAALVLAGGGIGAAVAAYMMSPKIEAVEFNDETLRIGLGKIEDYVASEKE